MPKLNIAWDAVITMVKEWVKTLQRPFLGSKKRQNKDMPKPNINWAVVIIMAKE